MTIALCKCGTDLSVHKGSEGWADGPEIMQQGDHYFEAAETKHRCEKLINYTFEHGMLRSVVQFLCPRPEQHFDHDVPCGPLTGEKLW